MSTPSFAAARHAAESERERNTRKFLLWILVVAIIFLIGAYAYIHWSTSPRTITDPTYYRGPIRNHVGDLVDIDGHILEKAKHRAPVGQILPQD